jgi:hypothetical protein
MTRDVIDSIFWPNKLVDYHLLTTERRIFLRNASPPMSQSTRRTTSSFTSPQEECTPLRLT